MPVVLEPVHCLTCNETQIVRHDKSLAGKQRYKCCKAAKGGKAAMLEAGGRRESP